MYMPNPTLSIHPTKSWLLSGLSDDVVLILIVSGNEVEAGSG